MNKIKIIAIVLLFISIIFGQAERNHLDKYRQRFSKSISIVEDERTKAPKKIISRNLSLSSTSIDKDNIEDLVREFLFTNKDVFNLEGSNIRLRNIVELDNLYIISFQQTYNGIPVWRAEGKH